MDVEVLIGALDQLRNGVLKKLDGLSDDDARWEAVPSGTNLAGLVQHLTFVEAKWFEQKVAGRKPSRGVRSMVVDPAVSLSELRSAYREACAASNEIIRDVGDAAAPISGAGKAGNLGGVMLVVLNETARHAGHADIIREQIDGTTGR